MLFGCIGHELDTFQEEWEGEVQDIKCESGEVLFHSGLHCEGLPRPSSVIIHCDGHKKPLNFVYNKIISVCLPRRKLCWIEPASQRLSAFLVIRRVETKVNVFQAYVDSTSTNLYFSTALPISLNTKWKYWSGMHQPSWEQPSFHDQSWSVRTCDGLPFFSPLTVYYRLNQPVAVPTQATAFVLSVTYWGGFAAYMNGATIARFFLPDVLNHTIAGEWPDSRTDKVTIPLRPDTSNLLIALEVHQPSLDVNYAPIIDGFFLFEQMPHIEATYSITIDQVYESNSTMVTGISQVTKTNINETTAIISFVNRAPVMFTSLMIAPLLNMPIKVLPERFNWSEDNLKASMDYYQGVFTSVSEYAVKFKYSSFISMSSMMFLSFNFTSAQSSYMDSTICGFASPSSSSSYSTIGVDRQVDYPWVMENAVTLMDCPEGRYGMKVLRCTTDGSLEVLLDHCAYHRAKDFYYQPDTYTFYVNQFSSTSLPLYEPTISKYELGPSTELPAGLYLNHTSGVISGIPTAIKGRRRYWLGGINEDVNLYSSGGITITVMVGECYENQLEVGQSILVRHSMEGCLWARARIHCVDGVNVERTATCYLSLYPTIAIFCILFCIAIVVTARHVGRRNRPVLPIVLIRR